MFLPRPLFICLVLLFGGPLILQHTYGQNLVPNPGFERYSELPRLSAEFNKVKEWFNPSGDGPASSEVGTPDLFHERGGTDVRIPDTKMGFVFPYKGEAIAGLILYNRQDEDLVDFREYLSVPLRESMVVGRKYEISFFYSTGIKDHYGKYASPNLHLSFTVERPRQDGYDPLFLHPHYSTPELKSNISWEEVSFEFVADRPYQYLTIGNFQRDTETKLVEVNRGVHAGECAYYFIDEVSVMEEEREEPEEEGEEVIPLVLTCPENQKLSADPGRCDRAIRYALPSVTGPEGTELKLVEGLESGKRFPVGERVVRYRASTPDGSVSECDFRIAVVDEEPPLVECPKDISIQALPGASKAIVNYPRVTATDNCNPVTAKLIKGKGSGAEFALGVTKISYSAVDRAGNVGKCSFTVRVTPTDVDLALRCPENMQLKAAKGKCGRVVTYTPPEITGPDNTTLTLKKGLRSGEFFPVGKTEIIYQASHPSGKTAECSFVVQVLDKEPPQLKCPEDIQIQAAPEAEKHRVTYPKPIVSDNCSDVLPFRASGQASGTAFSVGTTIIRYVGTDEAGNQSDCEFRVVIEPQEAPLSLTCPEDIVTTTHPGRCDRVVSYPKPEWNGPEGTKFGRIAGDPSGTKLGKGNHTVRYRVRAPSGEERECHFKIRVEDREPPRIECPEDILVKAGPGEKSKQVHYPVIIAEDNCGEVNVELVEGLESRADFPLGETVVKYQATDEANNQSDCAFKVKVDGLPEKIGDEVVSYQDGIITTRSRSITIYFYDAQVKDNDIISINVDGKWVLKESKIKKKKSDFWKTDNLTVVLEPGKLHYMVFQANDEGSIPPCTISLMMVDDKKNLIAERTVSFKIGESGGVVFKMK